MPLVGKKVTNWLLERVNYLIFYFLVTNWLLELNILKFGFDFLYFNLFVGKCSVNSYY